MKKRSLNSFIFYSLALILATGLISSCAKNQSQIKSVARPDTSSLNDYYISNKAPLKPASFVKLPIGSIQPKGWLMESLKRAKNGMTGRLGEVSDWLVNENNAWLSPTGEGVNGWEEVPYWLKGYGDLA